MKPGQRAALVGSALLLSACGGHAAQSAQQTAATPSADPAAAKQARRLTIPSGDWTRFNFNAARSGVGPAKTGINAGNVKRLRRQRIEIDGTVDSSAIELHRISIHGARHDVLVMTTTYGRTLALDAQTGKRLWEFTPSDIGSYAGSPQITTATPIADPTRTYVYSSSPDGRIHKLVLATGQEASSGHWPVSVTFDAKKEKIASALNISGGSVVVTTGGYVGDAPVYQGHVVTINRATGQIQHVWNSLCSNRHELIDPPSSCPASDSAIWARSGAVIEPGTGRILVATGNAPFNGVTNWGDSVLELAADASRLLHNWTPTNQAQLNATDGDVGSSAPALLPRFHGLRLAVQGSKQSVLDLLNLNRLNGTTGGAGKRLGGELQTIASPGGSQVFTAPAVWTHGGHTYVFVASQSATSAYMLGPNQPRLHVVWQTGSAGTSPVVAGGLLYVFDPDAGRLDVRQPTTGHLIASLPAGPGHWNSPIVIGGRIVLPVGDANDHATSGVVYIWHVMGR